MKNREIAAILFNISTLLRDGDGNPYRIRAYRRAARNILRLPYELADRVRDEQPLGVPQLGERLTNTITQLARDGHCNVYDVLLGELPSAERQLLQVPGIGPRLAGRITKEFGTSDVNQLVRKATRLGLEQIWGIGPKRAEVLAQELVPTTPPAAPQLQIVQKPDNVIYVQESFWDGERKQAA
jgi:DNA polymerase (family 10)